jgi:stage V sporulation protein S
MRNLPTLTTILDKPPGFANLAFLERIVYNNGKSMVKSPRRMVKGRRTLPAPDHMNIARGHFSVALKDNRGGTRMADIIRVAATSKSTAVAGAIAGVVREHGVAEVQAIGAGAVNQAVKASAIARGFLALDGLDVICIPTFTDVEIGGQERTAIRITVEPR